MNYMFPDMTISTLWRRLDETVWKVRHKDGRVVEITSAPDATMVELLELANTAFDELENR